MATKELRELVIRFFFAHGILRIQRFGEIQKGARHDALSPAGGKGGPLN